MLRVLLLRPLLDRRDDCTRVDRFRVPRAYGYHVRHSGAHVVHDLHAHAMDAALLNDRITPACAHRDLDQPRYARARPSPGVTAR